MSKGGHFEEKAEFTLWKLFLLTLLSTREKDSWRVPFLFLYIW